MNKINLVRYNLKRQKIQILLTENVLEVLVIKYLHDPFPQLASWFVSFQFFVGSKQFARSYKFRAKVPISEWSCTCFETGGWDLGARSGPDRASPTMGPMNASQDFLPFLAERLVRWRINDSYLWKLTHYQ